MTKYNIIYADPPWGYKDVRGDTKKFGSATSHYRTMSLHDIKNLPVVDLADNNCFLFMWATMPNLREAFHVIHSWGFVYKTCAFTWVKMNKKSDTWHGGFGNYTRPNAELCLLATRGRPRVHNKGKISSVLCTRIIGHSIKPPETRDKIVELCGDLPRVELFARQVVDGWDCWGNEIESTSDVVTTLQKE
jgi:N6-adenosine-specific RNA methylase IME4